MRLIFLEKNDVTFGVLIGLTLLVVVLMLIRSVMEEKENGATGGGGAAIDSKTLGIAMEGALKRALSDKTVLTERADSGAPAAAGDAVSAAASADLKRVLDEREAKIAALMSDLDLMKNQLDAKPADAIAGAGAADTIALHAKLNELQAKLSEYEIIEDDIADLSSFKEENKKLKDELERMRAAAQTAQAQVQTAQVSNSTPAPQSPAQDPVAVAQAAVASAEAPDENSLDAFAEVLANQTPTPLTAVTPPAATPPASPAAAEPFALDNSDDIMGEFAQALSGGSPEPAKAPEKPAATVAEKSDSLVVSNTNAAVVDPQAAIDALLAEAAASTPAASTAPDETADETADEAGPTDPFGPLDTEKMLEEVASLNADASAEASEGSSVLDDQLDTERLMAEMGMAPEPAKPEAEPTEAAEAVVEDDPAAEFAAAVAGVGMNVAKAKPAPVTTMSAVLDTAGESGAPSTSMSPAPAAAAVGAAPTPTLSDTPVDDLLAEFKDMDFGSKGTKGS